MGTKRGAGKLLTGFLAPRLPSLAPRLADSFVHEALHRSINGVGPLSGARIAAEAALKQHGGNRKRAVSHLIDHHVRYAGAQGFVTNLGGLTTMPITIPVNVTGLTLVQCRMIAAIAHLNGYDLADPRTRNAVLLCLLGPDKVDRLVTASKVPAPPMALATAPAHDPALSPLIAAEVATELITRVTGKHLLTTAGRRVPVLGGAVGGGTDALLTWQVGRYASKELRPRARR